MAVSELQARGAARTAGGPPGDEPKDVRAPLHGRHGEAPLAYLHRLRIDAARHLLETKQKSVAEVCRAVGYEDLAFFRRLFKRHTGAGPREYRDRFGARARAAAPPRANASLG